jgi:hypothetical protein
MVVSGLGAKEKGARSLAFTSSIMRITNSIITDISFIIHLLDIIFPTLEILLIGRQY